MTDELPPRDLAARTMARVRAKHGLDGTKKPLGFSPCSHLGDPDSVLIDEIWTMVGRMNDEQLAPLPIPMLEGEPGPALERTTDSPVAFWFVPSSHPKNWTWDRFWWRCSVILEEAGVDVCALLGQ